MNAPINPSGQPEKSQQPLPRSLAVSIIRTALAVAEVRFARQAALAWLAVYPGDLPVGLMHARALMQAGAAKGTSKSALAQAVPILESLCQADPEFLEARKALKLAREGAGIGESGENCGSIQVLTGSRDPNPPSPSWVPLLHQARQTIAHSKGLGYEQAERLVHQALLGEPVTPLAGITHLQVAVKRGLPSQSIHSLAELYHARWPNCTQFMLFIADSLIDGGESERAVQLLHQAAARDVTGQTPTRLWGENHPYRSLWPDRLEAPILQDLAVPAAVAAALGWNRLPSGHGNYDALPFVAGPAESPPVPPVGLPAEQPPAEDIHPVRLEPEPEPVELQVEEPTPAAPPSTPNKPRPASTRSYPSIKVETPSIPESLHSVQSELERVAAHIKKPQLARTDGRFPVYVLFTTRRGLKKHYGQQGADMVEAAMLRLVEAVNSRRNWNALLYYADDPGGSPGSKLESLHLKPARPADPWSLKLGLADLDTALRKRGEMIGAVLIVGGPEVAPFHLLPNPVDDDDVDVPSDNPYSTRDENYFVPEWPVGRLPGGCDKDAAPLLLALTAITSHHRQLARPRPFYISWWSWLVEKLWPALARLRPSLGYTAAIWRRASLAVFRPIGEARAMIVSPPTRSGNSLTAVDDFPVPGGPGGRGQAGKGSQPLLLHPARLGYFNLHGLVDSVEWYGQRDPLEPGNGPDYPVALRPEDIGSASLNGGRMNGNSVPQVIFSEACYGAHLEGRRVHESLALKFMAAGSQAVVGSTCIAYGAINSPLTAADLLGYSFWVYLSEGLPAGEALRRAKIRLAREMHRRQGYLDGEDQKTLISFVLYGDPLAQPMGVSRGSKTVLRPQKPPASVKLVCDRSQEPETPRPIPPEVLSYVKYLVEQYLPGMDGAQLTMSREHLECNGVGHDCPAAQLGAKAHPSYPPERQVVTLSKQVQKASHLHKHFARLTLDSQGKLVKLVVSR